MSRRGKGITDTHPNQYQLTNGAVATRPSPRDLKGDISIDYGDDDKQLCIMQGFNELVVDDYESAVALANTLIWWADWRKYDREAV